MTRKQAVAAFLFFLLTYFIPFVHLCLLLASCFCLQTNMATAIDVLGTCRSTGRPVVIEIKYSGHGVKNVSRTYKLPSVQEPRMRYTREINSLYNRHRLQLRETVKMFAASTKTHAKIQAGVFVVCGCGNFLFYRL